MIFDLKTKNYCQPFRLPSVRLHRSDDMFRTSDGKSVVILTGDELKCINRYEIRIN